MTLARSWEAAGGFPTEVDTIFRSSDEATMVGLEPLLISSVLYPLCEATKLLDDLLSIDQNDDWLGGDVAKDYKIPAAEARNR